MTTITTIRAGCDHEHEHSHAVLPLAQTLIGLVFIFNSFVITWVFGQGGNAVAAASAMIGAIILGYPIIWTALADLRRGLLTTNELVALAVLAPFGSADFYSRPGIRRPASSRSSCCWARSSKPAPPKARALPSNRSLN